MPYVELTGVNTYYEVNGKGSPVVLLHGGLAGAEWPDSASTAGNQLAEATRAEREASGPHPIFTP
jgi:pimeloyl-ACP methyl ester carboxylesterase